MLQYSKNPSAHVAPLQYRLRSLLLVMTWVAVCLCLARALPVLGLVAFALTLPAIARTWSDVARSQAAGSEKSTAEVVQTFLWSVALLVTISAVWLIMLVGALFASVLLMTLAGTWLCRFASIPLAHLGGSARGLPRYLVRTTARHMTGMSRLLRRQPKRLPRWMMVSAVLLAMLIYACVAAGVVSLTLLVVAFGYASRQSARLHEGCRRMKNRVISGMSQADAWKALGRPA